MKSKITNMASIKEVLPNYINLDKMTAKKVRALVQEDEYISKLGGYKFLFKISIYLSIKYGIEITDNKIKTNDNLFRTKELDDHELLNLMAHYEKIDKNFLRKNLLDKNIDDDDRADSLKDMMKYYEKLFHYGFSIFYPEYSDKKSNYISELLLD